MVGFSWTLLRQKRFGGRAESDLSDRWDGSDAVGPVDHIRAQLSGADFCSVFIGLNFGAVVFV
jgi:hypothetical protein